MKSLVNIFFISFIAFIVFFIHLDCQFKEQPGTIEYFAKKLSGKWKFIGYYENDEFVEKLISTTYHPAKKGKQLEKILTDSGFIMKKYTNDSLISVEKYSNIEVLEMNFNRHGQGDYQYYSEYIIGDNYQEPESCQPVPEIVLKNGKCYLHLVYMGGETEEEYIVKNDTLIQKMDEDNEIRYIRLLE